MWFEKIDSLHLWGGRGSEPTAPPLPCGPASREAQREGTPSRKVLEAGPRLRLAGTGPLLLFSLCPGSASARTLARYGSWAGGASTPKQSLGPLPGPELGFGPEGVPPRSGSPRRHRATLWPGCPSPTGLCRHLCLRRCEPEALEGRISTD